mmetsp:Transcript_1718/g.4984  ORF Transcript_1718/g.4984 Transcript_1718/m.4984 type:complete len:239 (-) Transcript_1718:135-851(-)
MCAERRLVPGVVLRAGSRHVERLGRSHGDGVRRRDLPHRWRHAGHLLVRRHRAPVGRAHQLQHGHHPRVRARQHRCGALRAVVVARRRTAGHLRQFGSRERVGPGWRARGALQGAREGPHPGRGVVPRGRAHRRGQRRRRRVRARGQGAEDGLPLQAPRLDLRRRLEPAAARTVGGGLPRRQHLCVGRAAAGQGGGDCVDAAQGDGPQRARVRRALVAAGGRPAAIVIRRQDGARAPA